MADVQASALFVAGLVHHVSMCMCVSTLSQSLHLPGSCLESCWSLLHVKGIQ